MPLTSELNCQGFVVCRGQKGEALSTGAAHHWSSAPSCPAETLASQLQQIMHATQLFPWCLCMRNRLEDIQQSHDPCQRSPAPYRCPADDCTPRQVPTALIALRSTCSHCRTCQIQTAAGQCLQLTVQQVALEACQDPNLCSRWRPEEHHAQQLDIDGCKFLQFSFGRSGPQHPDASQTDAVAMLWSAKKPVLAWQGGTPH